MLYIQQGANLWLYVELEKENCLNPFLLLTTKSSVKRIGLEFDNPAFMNKMIALFYLFFGVFSLHLIPATTTAQSADEITQSIQSGSSKSLSKFLNETVTLNINNNLSDYSKNQAEQIFRDFFRKNPPKEFKVLHQDESTDKSWHIIGIYHSVEADFRVLLKGTKQNEMLSISSMEFTKE